MSYKLLTKTEILMCGNKGNDYALEEKQQIDKSLKNEAKTAFKKSANRIII